MKCTRNFRESFYRATAPCILLNAGFLFISGCGAGVTQIPGVQNFNVAVNQNYLVASFVATDLHLNAGVTVPVPIPGLKDASVSIAPDLHSSGTVFQFSVGLQSLGNQGQGVSMMGLPDGRPLPDIVGGALPGWTANIHSVDLTIYLSNDVFGIFVPIQLSTSGGPVLNELLSIDIEDERGNRLGRAYAIPADAKSGSGSGLLVLLPYSGGGLTQANVVN